jgi:adenylylsulfate kinase-like enzyme
MGDKATQLVCPMGKVFWITGLSGAGKSTLAVELTRFLRTAGEAVVMLDGDELREAMGALKAHTRPERLQLASRYAHLCHMVASQGVDVVIATISLFREVHEWNRANMPGYVEIYLQVPLTELKRRDPKQIYARAARGELKDVAGLDFAVDEPQAPNVRIEWASGLTVEAALAQVIEQLNLESCK